MGRSNGYRGYLYVLVVSDVYRSERKILSSCILQSPANIELHVNVEGIVSRRDILWSSYCGMICIVSVRTDRVARKSVCESRLISWNLLGLEIQLDAFDSVSVGAVKAYVIFEDCTWAWWQFLCMLSKDVWGEGNAGAKKCAQRSGNSAEFHMSIPARPQFGRSDPPNTFWGGLCLTRRKYRR